VNVSCEGMTHVSCLEMSISGSTDAYKEGFLLRVACSSFSLTQPLLFISCHPLYPTNQVIRFHFYSFRSRRSLVRRLTVSALCSEFAPPASTRLSLPSRVRSSSFFFGLIILTFSVSRLYPFLRPLSARWRLVASSPLPSAQACPKKVIRVPRKSQRK